MKNFIKLIGIVALVAAIGFSMAACDIPKDDLDGTTWKASITIEGQTVNYVLTFDSPNFTLKMTAGTDSMTQKGTYSISGSTVTLTFPEGEDGETGTSTGTLSGNKLTIEGIEFTKQ